MKQFIEKITFKTKKSEILNITKIIEDMLKKVILMMVYLIFQFFTLVVLY